jgi:hypothetical protein
MKRNATYGIALIAALAATVSWRALADKGAAADGGSAAKAKSAGKEHGSEAATSKSQTPAAETTKKKEAVAESGASSSVAPLATRDIIERLKTLRSEILLEEEMSRLLKARLTRMQLERQVADLGPAPAPVASAPAPVSHRGRSPASAPAAAPAGPDATADLIVKAVTVQPFKEAIVTYRGRVYTVRPGDRLGPLTVKDVTESGLITTGGAGPRNLPLGR